MTLIRRRIEEMISADIRRQREQGSKKTAFGHYWEIINGVLQPVVVPNSLPTEGLNNCLDVWLGVVAKPAHWYITLYATAINPDATWTAANVTANSGEITSAVEGFIQVTRPLFTANAAAGGVLDSVGNEAQFTIATATVLSVEGCFVISDNTRGGGAGKLASAARFPQTRQLQNNDDYRLGYRVTMTG
jgi:hypothetical protein